ncbi:S1 domain-containing post-transcriptional regulator GSP13 [Lentibacillus sp. CBA3610]|uniref:S1 domain-containing post-transcriptional regulator GSP13 n=1 Tax=Lentibacillus sp. CBA3610 TaxID=2518176 RepID=UPI00159638BE|nr:S1 domain-containing post-transcriptional regulator GSP13 [Lentibacillus sp. CBA3610]QKY69771.1 general stress protein 13 [Lentibacillus sp. CBA3610]
MIDKFETGQILEGKVTGIQPYGAFVALDDDTQGLVHISEITYGYVKDINDHLAIDDTVNVKILNVDEENNKVSLSIRATQEPPKNRTNNRKNHAPKQQDNANSGFNTLKDKLDDWIKQSEEREGTFRK